MFAGFLVPALILAAPEEDPVKLAEAVEARIKEGRALLNAGKANEALAKFQEAAKLDPKSSWPVSAQAELFWRASNATSPEHVEEYRERARALANQAIDLNDLDYVATSVMGDLNGAPKESRHVPPTEAQQAFVAAEAKFGKGEYEAAIADYAQALKLDPAFTDAALYQGDCHFALKRYREAEGLFRKAIDLEPTYARAWRFLFDCLLRQKLWDDLEATGRQAIAAEPDDFTAWARLRQAREAQGRKGLTRFTWPPVGRVKLGPEGKKTEILVAMDDTKKDSLDSALALGVLMTRAAAMSLDSKSLRDLGLEGKSPFQRELQAWSSALDVLEEHLKSNEKPMVGEAWLQLRDMRRAGHLDSALYLLAFRPEYRPDFEAWKKADPRKIEAFIERFALRP